MGRTGEGEVARRQRFGDPDRILAHETKRAQFRDPIPARATASR